MEFYEELAKVFADADFAGDAWYEVLAIVLYAGLLGGAGWALALGLAGLL